MISCFMAAARSFVEMLIQHDRTASLEDTSLRPDLNILSVPGHQRFAAVLSSPLHVEVSDRCNKHLQQQDSSVDRRAVQAERVASRRVPVRWRQCGLQLRSYIAKSRMSSWQTSSKPLLRPLRGLSRCCWAYQQGIRAAHGLQQRGTTSHRLGKTLTLLNGWR